MSPVEIITSVERRRYWSAEQKRAMVAEAEQSGNSMSSVARKYGVRFDRGYSMMLRRAKPLEKFEFPLYAIDTDKC